MTTWAELYADHTAMRAQDAKVLVKDLRHRLTTLAKLGHCDASIEGRFTHRNHGNLSVLQIRALESAPANTERLDLPGLGGAHLTVLATIHLRSGHLHEFTAALSAKRADNTLWTVAIHLEDDRESEKNDRKGDGACSHAAIHCHVGPDLDTAPKVRVPLPAVGPVGALDWLLSTVVPGWEPALWPEVLAALKPAGT